MDNNKTKIMTAELEKPKVSILKDKKHKSLFEDELRNVYFPPVDKAGLASLIDFFIESLSITYLMWYRNEKADPSTFKDMSMPSIWFFVYGVILQMLVTQKWQMELSNTVAETIANYVISQALDLFGIRSGVVKVS